MKQRFELDLIQYKEHYKSELALVLIDPDSVNNVFKTQIQCIISAVFFIYIDNGKLAV